jgi:sortase A
MRSGGGKLALQTRTNSSNLVERLLLLIGILLVGVYFGASLHGAVASRIAIWRFDHAQLRAAGGGAGIPVSNDTDVSLWSTGRIQAYKESLAMHFDPPNGVLRISRLGFVAPIFDGTDDLTLNRGLGRVVGTAELGDSGNIGIAGHRDGFFRVLKDIQVGDAIDIVLASRTIRYVVRSREIVNSSDNNVLKATNHPELTLVTCYPFYFVGSAPQRFIVHATPSRNDAPR